MQPYPNKSGWYGLGQVDWIDLDSDLSVQFESAGADIFAHVSNQSDQDVELKFMLPDEKRADRMSRSLTVKSESTETVMLPPRGSIRVKWRVEKIIQPPRPRYGPRAQPEPPVPSLPSKQNNNTWNETRFYDPRHVKRIVLIHGVTAHISSSENGLRVEISNTGSSAVDVGIFIPNSRPDEEDYMIDFCPARGSVTMNTKTRTRIKFKWRTSTQTTPRSLGFG